MVKAAATLDDLFQAFLRSTEAGWKAAGSYLAQALQELVGIDNPTRRVGKNGNVWYERGSPEGSPPWKRTGEGQANIRSELIANGVQVGIDDAAWYMREHDKGMPYPHGTQQRPWFIKNGTWKQFLPDMLRIFRRHAKRPRGTT